VRVIAIAFVAFRVFLHTRRVAIVAKLVIAFIVAIAAREKPAVVASLVRALAIAYTAVAIVIMASLASGAAQARLTAIAEA